MSSANTPTRGSPVSPEPIPNVIDLMTVTSPTSLGAPSTAASSSSMLAPLESFVPLESANSPPPASNQPAKSQQLAPFLTKTLEMLENADNAGSIESGYIHWAEDGQSIFVEKPEQFAALILAKYYKHSNFSSFVRQLHIYGFRKVKDSSALPGREQFKHDTFHRGITTEDLRAIDRARKKKEQQNAAAAAALGVGLGLDPAGIIMAGGGAGSSSAALGSAAGAASGIGGASTNGFGSSNQGTGAFASNSDGTSAGFSDMMLDGGASGSAGVGMMAEWSDVGLGAGAAGEGAGASSSSASAAAAAVAGRFAAPTAASAAGAGASSSSAAASAAPAKPERGLKRKRHGKTSDFEKLAREIKDFHKRQKEFLAKIQGMEGRNDQLNRENARLFQEISKLHEHQAALHAVLQAAATEGVEAINTLLQHAVK